MDRFIIQTEPPKKDSFESTFFGGAEQLSTWIFYRITLREEVTRDLVSGLLAKEANEGERVCTLVSYEKGKKRQKDHCHILSNRGELVQRLKTLYPYFKGNGYYSICAKDFLTQESLDKAFRYVLKEGDFEYWGIPKEIILRYKKECFQPSRNFTERLEAFRVSFIKDKNPDMHSWLVKLIMLRAEFNQLVNVRQLADRLMLWRIQSEGEQFARRLADEYFEQQGSVSRLNL